MITISDKSSLLTLDLFDALLLSSIAALVRSSSLLICSSVYVCSGHRFEHVSDFIETSINHYYGAGQHIPMTRKLYLRVNQRVEPGVAVDLLFFQRIKPAVGCGRKLRQLLDGDRDLLNGFFKGLFEPIL